MLFALAGLFALFMIMLGFIVGIWFGPAGLYLLAPGFFLLASVVGAAAVEVRLKEGRARQRAVERDKELVRRRAELLRSIELRRARVAAEKAAALSQSEIAAWAAATKEAAERFAAASFTPVFEPLLARNEVVMADGGQECDAEAFAFNVLAGLDIKPVLASVGLAVEHVSISLSARAGRGAKTRKDGMLSLSFDVPRQFVRSLSARQRRELMFTMGGFLCSELMARLESNADAPRLSHLFVSGWSTSGGGQSVKQNRECILAAAGALQRWRSLPRFSGETFGERHFRDKLGLRWKDGSEVRLFDADPARGAKAAGRSISDRKQFSR